MFVVIALLFGYSAYRLLSRSDRDESPNAEKIKISDRFQLDSK